MKTDVLFLSHRVSKSPSSVSVSMSMSVSMSVYSSETVVTKNTHGTGCTLSSAIAAFIARGLSLEDAISEAKNYVTEAIRAGADINIGKGIGPVNHAFNPQKMIVL